MRRIKFRGLCLEHKVWLYGSLISFDPIPVIKETTIGEMDYDYPENEVIPESVGQFTGLKDKNGTEIYEGDILNHPNSGDFLAKFEDSGFYLFYNGVRQNHVVSEHMKVVGNIHENKLKL